MGYQHSTESADARAANKDGSSNRVRNVYERVLQSKLGTPAMDCHRKNKHVSLGRCRKLAIDHSVPMPTYEDLKAAGFKEGRVPTHRWIVPDDCKRKPERSAEEGRCQGSCVTCSGVLSSRNLIMQVHYASTALAANGQRNSGHAVAWQPMAGAALFAMQQGMPSPLSQNSAPPPAFHKQPLTHASALPGRFQDSTAQYLNLQMDGQKLMLGSSSDCSCKAQPSEGEGDREHCKLCKLDQGEHQSEAAVKEFRLADIQLFAEEADATDAAESDELMELMINDTLISDTFIDQLYEDIQSTSSDLSATTTDTILQPPPFSPESSSESMPSPSPGMPDVPDVGASPHRESPSPASSENEEELELVNTMQARLCAMQSMVLCGKRAHNGTLTPEAKRACLHMVTELQEGLERAKAAFDGWHGSNDLSDAGTTKGAPAAASPSPTSLCTPSPWPSLAIRSLASPASPAY